MQNLQAVELKTLLNEASKLEEWMIVFKSVLKITLLVLLEFEIK